MQGAELFAVSHPFWDWLAVGALLLVFELNSGSGYLLWPAASAGAVALLSLFLTLSPAIQVLVFVGLTIATTYLGRRYLRPAEALPGPDLNDKITRLVGRAGQVTHAFSHGHGRVFVDGAEWAADLDGDAALDKGQAVEVIAVLGGGRLKVRPS
jgi:membrane protein implicated in regulation of membrane protease activity